jgi:cell division protein FtsA
MHTLRNTVSSEVSGDGIVSQELVDRLCDENLALPLEEMDILDVVPQEYIIDNERQSHAVGIAGHHVTAQFLNIVARTPLKKNLERGFGKAETEIADLLIAPKALADVVLTDAEKRSGCALIDLGADTTTVLVYKNSILRFLSVIPLGSNNITRDIATLQLEESEAELLKQRYGDVCYESETSDVPATCQTEDGRAILLSQLNDVISARAEEILDNAWNQIQLSEYDERLLSGVVLTGGGANLRHVEELFRRLTKLNKVRIARFVPFEVHGMENEWKKDGTQNTLLGLLAAGRENCCAQKEEPKQEEPEGPEDVVPPVPDKPRGMRNMFGDIPEKEELKDPGTNRTKGGPGGKGGPKGGNSTSHTSWGERFTRWAGNLFSDDEEMK